MLKYDIPAAGQNHDKLECEIDYGDQIIKISDSQESSTSMACTLHSDNNQNK